MSQKPYLRPGIRVTGDFSIDHLLIHTADLYRLSKTRNPAGGFKTDWSLVEESMPCRFTVYSPKQVQIIDEGKEQFPTSFKVFTHGDADVRKKDRFQFKGQTYDVEDVLNPSFLDHHLEIEVKVTEKEV